MWDFIEGDLIETAIDSDESAVIINSADNSSICLEMAHSIEPVPKVLDFSLNNEEAIKLDTSTESAAEVVFIKEEEVKKEEAKEEEIRDEEDSVNQPKPFDEEEEAVHLETTNESMDTSKESIAEMETINEKKITVE